MRLRSLRGWAGFSEWRFSSTGTLLLPLLDADEVRDVAELALELRRDRVLSARADAAQAERSQGACMGLGLADRASHLGDADSRHSAVSSPSAGVGVEPSGSGLEG